MRVDSAESFDRDPEEFAGKDSPLPNGGSANSGGEWGAARTPIRQFCARRRGLPGMSGYQVAESLRSELKLNDALILAVTGYVHEKDRLRSRHAGIDYHLVKPVEYEVLATVISTWQTSGRKRPLEDVP